MEKRLLGAKNRVLGILPFLILPIGMLYGGLRFSGWLLYPTDGWDQWGRWNAANQNSGVQILFICGCMLAGAMLAMYKERSFRKG